MSAKPRIVVVGAGAVGLSTAVQIQEALPGNVVTLIAEKFDQRTTSYGVSGLFIPSVRAPAATSKELLAKWAKDSFEFFKQLLTSEDAAEAGISHVIGYGFYTNDVYVPEPLIEKIYFDFRPCTEKERSIFPSLDKKAKNAYFISTLMMEGRWLLPYLLKRFTKNGGRVEKRKLDSLDELSGLYDVAVLCTGLGAHELLGDEEVVPVRGQVIRVDAPWIKYFMFNDAYQSFIIPGKETCVIGGTGQVGNDNLEISKDDTDRMWKDICHYVPSLARAEWKLQWVGLRPSRKSIRVERESKELKNGQIEVVHNYGHGGQGMGLSWGTGKHATELVIEAIREKFD